MKAIFKCLKACALFTSMLGASGADAADQYFTFSYSGSGINGSGVAVTESGSGILGGTATNGGVYFINSVAGTGNGQVLSLTPTTTLFSLPCPTQYGPCYSTTFYEGFGLVDYLFDNVINMSGTGLFLDSLGLGFQTSSGNAINLVGNGVTNQYVYFDEVLDATDPLNPPGIFVTVNIAPLTASAAITNLETTVTNLGPGTSLASETKLALNFIQRGNVFAACVMLKIFDFEVQALTRGRVPPNDALSKSVAAALTAQTGIVESSLACP